MPGQMPMVAQKNQVKRAELVAPTKNVFEARKSIFSGFAQFYQKGSLGSGVGSVSNIASKRRRT